MSEIKELVLKLELAVTELHDKYVMAHRALEPYSDTPLTDETAKEANIILKDIQDMFNELYHAYYWILHRSEYASNAVNSYNAFIDKLKSAGAKPLETEGNSIIVAPEEAQG